MAEVTRRDLHRLAFRLRDLESVLGPWAAALSFQFSSLRPVLPDQTSEEVVQQSVAV